MDQHNPALPPPLPQSYEPGNPHQRFLDWHKKNRHQRTTGISLVDAFGLTLCTLLSFAVILWAAFFWAKLMHLEGLGILFAPLLCLAAWYLPLRAGVFGWVLALIVTGILPALTADYWRRATGHRPASKYKSEPGAALAFGIVIVIIASIFVIQSWESSAKAFAGGRAGEQAYVDDSLSTEHARLQEDFVARLTEKDREIESLKQMHREALEKTAVAEAHINDDLMPYVAKLREVNAAQAKAYEKLQADFASYESHALETVAGWDKLTSDLTSIIWQQNESYAREARASQTQRQNAWRGIVEAEENREREAVEELKRINENLELIQIQQRIPR
jgi:hypothetical protein